MTYLEADKALQTALQAAYSKGNSSLSAQERRKLTALQLAAGDTASALTQWLQLGPAEQIAGDGIDLTMKAQLESYHDRMDESYQIAARLAARLGHIRVYPADDRAADHLNERNNGEVWDHMRTVWARRDDTLRSDDEAASENVENPEGFLDYVRFMNSRDLQIMAIEGDFIAAARDTENPALARRYLAWWQTRGLRMAANVAQAAGDHPG